MKVQISRWRVIGTYSVVALLIGIVFYTIPGITFPPTIAHYVVMGAWLISTIIFIILSLKTTYYILDKNRIIYHRLNKDLFYDYRSILYIDHDWSKKHKTLLFYTDLGHARYLPFDQQGLLYEKVCAKAKNLISKEEYLTRFPKVKM